MTAALRSKARASPNSGASSTKVPTDQFLPQRGVQAKWPSECQCSSSYFDCPFGCQCKRGNRRPTGRAPTAVSVQARSAGASDRRGNTLYVQQVLQQIQHNPDPRLIENLAEHCIDQRLRILNKNFMLNLLLMLGWWKIVSKQHWPKSETHSKRN